MNDEIEIDGQFAVLVGLGLLLTSERGMEMERKGFLHFFFQVSVRRLAQERVSRLTVCTIPVGTV